LKLFLFNNQDQSAILYIAALSFFVAVFVIKDLADFYLHIRNSGLGKVPHVSFLGQATLKLEVGWGIRNNACLAQANLIHQIIGLFLLRPKTSLVLLQDHVL
jgi:hypothetical protein